MLPKWEAGGSTSANPPPPAFNTTPQKWLTQKRLEPAHYRLAERKVKPIEACYEAGFENLSHFSFAFKKQLGYAPTEAPQSNYVSR